MPELYNRLPLEDMEQATAPCAQDEDYLSKPLSEVFGEVKPVINMTGLRGPGGPISIDFTDNPVQLPPTLVEKRTRQLTKTVSFTEAITVKKYGFSLALQIKEIRAMICDYLWGDPVWSYNLCEAMDSLTVDYSYNVMYDKEKEGIKLDMMHKHDGTLGEFTKWWTEYQVKRCEVIGSSCPTYSRYCFRYVNTRGWVDFVSMTGAARLELVILKYLRLREMGLVKAKTFTTPQWWLDIWLIDPDKVMDRFTEEAHWVQSSPLFAELRKRNGV